jgi:hypothetical protein
MIKFKYTLPRELLPLIRQVVVDYTDDFMYGCMNEGLVGQLKHCTLFLVCEYEEINSQQVYRNPVVVVARNDSAAVETYNEMTNKIGFILHRITEDCSTLTVEPVD